jgi:hypothetical protein
MDITIEQVEKLMERTDISYAEAKTALEAADGDILEAIIALEKAGKTANQTGSYSTNGAPPAGTAANDGSGQNSYGGYGGQNDGASANETSNFGPSLTAK